MARGLPKTTIRMPEQMESTVQDMADDGPYQSVSEVIRSALRAFDPVNLDSSGADGPLPADRLYAAADTVETARDGIQRGGLDFDEELPDDAQDLSGTCAKIESVLRELAVNTEVRQETVARENGETVSAAEARERLGLDDNGGDGDE